MIKNRSISIQILIVGLLTLMLSGCSNNSEITNSYVNPELHNLDLDGVLVVAVAQQKSARIEFEDAYTKALIGKGVRAEASYKRVPSMKAKADEFVAAAKAAGMETVLMTRYLGETVDDVYHPGTIYYGVTPVYGMGHHGHFGGSYGHAYEVAYDQPQWTSNVKHALVSDLYVTETRGHIWQAVSETIEGSSTRELRDNAIDSLIGDLNDQGLLD